ncbi:MAG: hypothetical protein KF765_12410 [Parvibaculaceae bacterium]|nr:hypothetical protein [Parvibaculaceae bacterium]
MRAPRTTKPGAQARVLAMLSERKVCLTLDQLADELSDIARKKITASVSTLITQRFVERADKGCYQATKEGVEAHRRGYRPGPQRPLTGTRKPRPDTLRERVWRTMMMRGRFSVPDLLENACKGTEKDAASNIVHYTRALAKAGYVRELSKRLPGTAPESNGYKQFLLLRKTGMRAPVIRAHAVYDPNTGEEIAFGGEA